MPPETCRVGEIVRAERGQIYCALEVLQIKNRYNENDGVSKRVHERALPKPEPGYRGWAAVTAPARGREVHRPVKPGGAARRPGRCAAGQDCQAVSVAVLHWWQRAIVARVTASAPGNGAGRRNQRTFA